MERLLRPGYALLVIAAVLFSGQARAQSASADKILEQLRTTYGTLDALRADFTQQVGDHVLSGTITLQGDRYRIETDDQVLVSDAQTAWAFSRLDNQVLVSAHSEEAAAFAPSTFFTRYPDRFEVAVIDNQTLDGALHHVLRLTPLDADLPVREVTLFVRATDSMPTRVRVVDSGGSRMTFSLGSIERNPRIAADAFRFTAPAGAEVIDLR